MTIYFHALPNSPLSSHPTFWNWDSPVGLATRFRSARSGVRIPATIRNISVPPNAWVPASFIQGFIRYRSSFPRVKRPGRDLDHSHPSSAEIKNGWRHTSTPPICLYGMDRDKFTIYSVVRRYIARHNVIVIK